MFDTPTDERILDSIREALHMCDPVPPAVLADAKALYAIRFPDTADPSWPPVW